MQFPRSSRFRRAIWTLVVVGNLFWIERSSGATGELQPLAASGRGLMLSEATVDELVDRVSGTLGATAIVRLPVGRGWQRFRVEASQVLPPALGERYPRIRSFRGRGLDDPSASVRFELTPDGLRASIARPGRVPLVIEPVDGGHGVQHAFRNAGRARSERARLECHTAPGSKSGVSGRSAQRRIVETGETRRILRLAVASAAEFTQLHGGTVETALAAITTVVNRANEVLERDFSISLQLVDGNDRLIYTDPATDPYTISDFLVMMQENQATLDAIIGDRNYDIGHVFGGRGGGIVGGFACTTGAKAMGLSNDSRGDLERFAIRLFSHEIGHQLGAGHTFNSAANLTCGFARFPDQAFEPGSGTTIMAYAGLCESENVQIDSDDYFHAGTFDKVMEFMSVGPGAGCGTTTTLDNRPPEVDAGRDRRIPSRTPFRLAGDAVDPDQDVLSYTWEQLDLGPPSPPLTDDGERPLFRSFPPSPTAERFFPSLDDLRRRLTTIGETLPTKKREITLRLTARDGRGGVASDTAVLRVVKKAGPFALTTPRAGDRWTVGERELVEWNVARTDRRPIRCEAVEIALSTDGGRSVATTLLASTPNDGSQRVVVPDLPTDEARLVVACAENVFFAMSRRNFSIEQ